METPFTPTLEQLLAHAPWARALARELVLDQARADDVVQQAWLAACERPPTPGPGLRVWLARRIRNVARNQRRADARRAQHEELAAAPERSNEPPVSDVVSEFEAQQLVAQALLDLDEPYRETLLRRWYRDEKPAAIASAMQVPVKTVETRLARGLERLRAELTARKGGTSREWSLMLVPLAKAGAATGAVAVSTGGALTMSGVLKLTAAAAVAAAGVTTWTKVVAHRSDGPKVSQERPVASAQDANGAQKRAAGAAAPATDEATRAKELESAAPASAVDPLAQYRGSSHLHGRVIEEGTRKPIVGCTVTAWWGNGIQLAPPWIGEATTDADGQFTLERLGSWTGVSLHADGHVTKYANFRESDLVGDRADAPRVFELEPRTFGSLVVTLRSRNGDPLPRSIMEGASVLCGPIFSNPENAAYFEGLLKRAPDGSLVEQSVSVEPKDGVWRFERAPARVDLRLTALVGLFRIASIRLEPLAPGEARAIPLAVDGGIVVSVHCVDAATREPVTTAGLRGIPQPELRWTGPRARDHWRRGIDWDLLSGPLVLPGAGHVEIEGAFEGFAPFRAAADVADGTPVEIALTRGRMLLVKVRDERGDPWKKRLARREADATTASKFGYFLAAGRAPNCVVVAAGAPLPSELDPDAPVAAKLHRWFGGGYAMDGFRGFAPSERLRVGIYDDGRLVGSADVPAVAPLLVDEPASRPPGRSGAIVPDPSPDAPADATQTVTVRIALPPPSDGALRFRVVDRDDGRAVAQYSVSFEPIVLDDFESDGGEGEFEVQDSRDGLFSFGAIPAGDWRMRIARGEPAVAEWVGRVTIDAGRTTDLGTLTVGVAGTLDLLVVDESGAPAVDAEIRVVTADGSQPLEFQENVTGFARRTSARTIPRPGPVKLELASGRVRVEVRSDGFTPAFAVVDVPPAGRATCSITLKELTSGDASAAPEKK